MNAETLKACPFCGDEQIEDWGEATWSRPSKWLYCTCCQAQGPRLILERDESEDDFMRRISEAWNGRVAHAPQLAADNIALQAEVERLREAVDGLVRFSGYIETQIGNCEEIDPNDFMAFCLYLESTRAALND